MRTFTIVFITSILFNSFQTVGKTNTDRIEDSLLNIISSVEKLEQKVRANFYLVEYYKKNDFEKAIKTCNEAIEYCTQNNQLKYAIEFKIEMTWCKIYLGKSEQSSKLLNAIEKDLSKTNDNLLWGKFYLLKSQFYFNTGEFAKAMENAINAIDHFNNINDKHGLSDAYNLIGNIYDYTTNINKALENYLQAKKYALEINNEDLVANLNNNIGVIYENLNDHSKALEYYFKALEYNNSIGDYNKATDQLSNIATVLATQKRFDEARAYFKKALKFAISTKNICNEALLYLNIGEVFIKLQQPDSTAFYLKKSLDLYQECNDKYRIAKVYNILSENYILKKQYQKALVPLLKSIDIASKLNILPLQKTNYKLLSEIYVANNNYKKAFEYQRKALAISDSIYEKIKLEEIKYSDYQIAFLNQSGKYEADLRKYDAEYKAKLKKERTQKYFYGLLFFLIVIIAFILFRNFKKSKKINKKLVIKNKEVKDQKDLIEISHLELREQYTFTETLLNTIPNPVFYTDKSSHILGCNKAFAEVSGKLTDEVIGLKLSHINIDFKTLCESKKLDLIENKQLIKNEGTLTYADNSKHDVICYRKGIIYSDTKIIGILGIILDVTEIKKTEKKLKLSQTRLKEAINAKDKFFNLMAHDLKNPFNAILGLTSFINDDFETHSEQDLRQYIGLINQSASNIYNLLENMLEWARAQSGSIDKNPSIFEINDVIQDCVNLFVQSFEQKNIKLEVNIPKQYEIKADKNMIMSVMRNLINNAIKFTPQKGKITIDVSKNDADKLKVEVIDTGVGIAEQNIDKLFKIDQPLSTPGINNEKGTGLGLIISHEFIKLNGGTISVNSEINKGSKFTITLPVEL